MRSAANVLWLYFTGNANVMLYSVELLAIYHIEALFFIHGKQRENRLSFPTRTTFIYSFIHHFIKSIKPAIAIIHISLAADCMHLTLV